MNAHVFAKKNCISRVLHDIHLKLCMNATSSNCDICDFIPSGMVMKRVFKASYVVPGLIYIVMSQRNFGSHSSLHDVKYMM